MPQTNLQYISAKCISLLSIIAFSSNIKGSRSYFTRSLLWFDSLQYWTVESALLNFQRQVFLFNAFWRYGRLSCLSNSNYSLDVVWRLARVWRRPSHTRWVWISFQLLFLFMCDTVLCQQSSLASCSTIINTFFLISDHKSRHSNPTSQWTWSTRACTSI